MTRSRGVRTSFEDIHALAAEYRFSDCTHRHEPGCAVQQALAEGRIEQDRYLNYLQILAEAAAEEYTWKLNSFRRSN